MNSPLLRASCLHGKYEATTISQLSLAERMETEGNSWPVPVQSFKTITWLAVYTFYAKQLAVASNLAYKQNMCDINLLSKKASKQGSICIKVSNFKAKTSNHFKF